MQPASSSNIPADSGSSASAEAREAATNNAPQRKRRRMATSHGVQQIPETSAVLLPPQQQEQSTLPPIEQRLVAEHQAAATVSFAGAEPTETDRPDPAAAFAEAPTADEPMAIEAGPAAEETPLGDLIANFLPRHQEEIREHLKDEDVQQILNAVRNFLTLLSESGIKLSPGRGRIPTPTLFGRLRNLSVTRDAETIRKFFVKATSFFSAVNPAQTKSTSCLSSMLDSNTHITNFANETDDNLRLLASHPYLKQIASMCSRKGVPDPVKAVEILEWDCWKIDGTFCPELLRAYSSMMTGRGLIKDQAKMVEMLAWECWQVDGEFSLELLRAVSSMLNHRGFPDKDTSTTMLAWDCWKIAGKFSMELLRTISSMMSRKGFPDKVKLEALLAWDCWKIDSKFSLELLRIFSSMKRGRGLLDNKAQVQAILAWDCWRIDGKFSIGLLRRFSSMHHSKGLFKDQNQIKAILAWPCWQLNGKFSSRLLQCFSSMMSSRGLPERASIENILSWDCWKIDGKFSLKLLQIFSVMMNGKGMPDQTTSEAFLAWLSLRTETSDKGQVYLRSAWSAFTSTGVPDPKVLADIEVALRPYFTKDITSDDEHRGDSVDEPSEIGQLKALTLFCAASAEWQRNLGEIQQFLAAYNITSHSQTVVHTIVDSLLQILAHHRQAGVRLWLEHHSRQPDSRSRLTAALSISAPLAHTKFAVTQLPESEWPEYIELCRNLLPKPDKEQWQALKPLRDLLHRRFTLTLKRMMLEILWPQSEHNRLRYAEKLDTLLNTVPTIYQLYRLHQAFKPQKLQAFLDACLARENMADQSINETVPEIKTQEVLLEGLLLSNHYLSKHERIPDLCFSKQVAGTDGSGVIVDGDAEMSGHQRLWHFIAAMLIELKQTGYQLKQQKLRISPPDSEPIVLPKPEFTAANTGFMITNWSLEQLTAFFRATEFTEHWYKNPDDTWGISITRREQRLQQMRASPQDNTQTGHTAGYKSSRSLLSPSVIINIIKQGNRLRPAVWSSLEHYAKKGKLSGTLCRLLAPIIEKELASTTARDAIPEIVQKTVAKRLRRKGTSETAAVATATQPLSSTSALATTPSPYASPIMSAAQMAPATQDMDFDMALDMALDATLKVTIEELEHFPVLGSAELDMLEPLRDQMTYSQLMNVMTKIDLQSVEPEAVTAWQQTFENRTRDHLGLDLDELLDSLLEGAAD